MKIANPLLIFFMLLSVHFFFSLPANSSNAKQVVLVLHSYHQEHLWTGFMKKGIDEVLVYEENIIVHHEYLDAKRYPSVAYKNEFIQYLMKKYNRTEVDVVMASDDAALIFLRQHKHSFMVNVPVVYLGINKVTPDLLNEKNYTGIFETRDIAATAFDIKALTKHDALIVVADSSISGQTNLAKLLAAKGDIKAPQTIHIIDDLLESEVSQKLGHFNHRIPILKIGQLRYSANNPSLLSWNKGTQALSRVLKNPIFTLSSTSLPYGAAGFHELNGEQHGKQAAGLVKRLLQGENIQAVLPITTASSVWTFNWQLLKKYQYQENNLPLGSIINFRDVSFYQQNKMLVWLVVIAFFVAIVVIGLLSEVIRRGRINQRVLAENENRYKDLAHAGANIFWEINPLFVISYISGNTQAVWNKKPAQLIGMPLTGLMESDEIEFPILELEHALTNKQPIDHIIFKRKFKKNKAKVFLLNGNVIRDGMVFRGYRGICNDVTQEQRLSEKLIYQASYDSLTSLINRENFNLQLAQFIEQYQKGDGNAYLCFLDLDRFKLVNDTAGHIVGDAMLGQVAKKLNAQIETIDVLGRLGGDEFGLLLINKTHQQALTLCENIVTAINQYTFSWGKRDFNVGISIGMVGIVENISAIELLSKADIACYKAKELGKSRVYSTTADSDELYQDEQQMSYIANVGQAIVNNQFYLMKQVISGAKDSNKHTHYEVLIRYKDEHGNVISPVLFIPVAEKFGVISVIDEWVVTTVLDNFEQYFFGVGCVSINLSGLSLSNEPFIERIIQHLEESKVDPTLLCFEITETAAISNMRCALAFISKMKALGIRFALDDFGSGASSFGYLKSLPVDYLKIDGSLVKNMLTEPVDRAIVESIHDIAQMLGMKTIAEFVENDEIKQALADIGVDYVQGYGIGKPEPA